MKNISLTRIDDRLIHGQVMTAWIQYTRANEVVIVDDKVAKDEFSKMIMQSAMPKRIKLKVLSTQSAIEYLLGEPESVDNKYFLLVKTPQPILSMIKAGVVMKDVCIGGMGAKADRKPFYRNISASEDEIKCLEEINNLGVKVFAQVLTDNNPVKLDNIGRK